MQPRPLYTSDALLAGFQADHPLGFVNTFDFQMYVDYVAAGGPSPRTLGDAVIQSIHDAEIGASLREFLTKRTPRLVGVMGGHKLDRSHRAYLAVARLSRTLAENNFMVASGGGPGAMEASHVGAALAGREDAQLVTAIDELKRHPKLPNMIGLLDDQGRLRPDREADAKKAHEWLRVAVEVRESLGTISESLAIPTWLYGQEPTMPFATAYAKYFHNSIREEALVQQSRAGIVYARGGGGTVREIFQDIEENYYAAEVRDFTPMIFFDPDGYWQRNGTSDNPGIKIDDSLTSIITFAHLNKPNAGEYLAKIAFTTDESAILDLLAEHSPRAIGTMIRLLRTPD